MGSNVKGSTCAWAVSIRGDFSCPSFFVTGVVVSFSGATGRATMAAPLDQAGLPCESLFFSSSFKD